jgi:hypothetical protein
MSKIVADSLASRGGQSIAVDNGVNVTGIVTATSFSGVEHFQHLMDQHSQI